MSRRNSLCASGGLPAESSLAHILTIVEEAWAAEQKSLDGSRTSKEAVYAAKLAVCPEVVHQATLFGIAPEKLRELATLFAELDVRFVGSAPPHDLSYFLARLGRAAAAPAEDIVEFALSLCQRSPAPPPSVREGLARRLDFLDFLDALYSLAMSVEGELLQEIYPLIVKRWGTQVELQELAELFQQFQDPRCRLFLRPAQLREVAESLGLSVTDRIIGLKSQEQFFELFEGCRRVEARRFLERAGFSYDEVEVLKAAFDRKAGRSHALDTAGTWALLSDLGFVGSASEADLAETVQSSDLHHDGSFSFEEIVHLARRCLDFGEFQAVREESLAAETAGLSDEEVIGLRGLYDTLLQEEAQLVETPRMLATRSLSKNLPSTPSPKTSSTAREGHFSYVALTKAVRMFGASLSPEYSARLEATFLDHAAALRPWTNAGRASSKPVVSIEAKQLTFPGFLLVVGDLWSSDFAGIRSRAERRWRNHTGSRLLRLLRHRLQAAPR